MPGLIPGYEYDIFISYRQKDNKGEQWVSEFVNALKNELESTFKEEISLYFDINPHDGLLETHDVSASLKEKLKCLVFIPIISRTYCDPKSFAWEHEFKAFADQASHDRYGLMVKLPAGNVANRVLPVRIHDLDNADIKLCESVLGGVLRGVEFIYKEPGVNRSLTPKDEERKNLNGTIYRNQINKVALAIKELISGLNSATELPSDGKAFPDHVKAKPELKDLKKNGKKRINPGRLKIVTAIVISALLIIASTIGIKMSGSKDKRIAVAVLPFANMTGDTTKNLWIDWMQDIMITSLADNPEELIVRQTESINPLLKTKGITDYSSISTSIASKISRDLESKVFILGSIKQSGDLIRLNAQLIDARTEEVLKTFPVEGSADEKNMRELIVSLSSEVKDFLLISKMNREIDPNLRSYQYNRSPEALKYFAIADEAYISKDNPTAIKYYELAVERDSDFITAMVFLSFRYMETGRIKDAKELCLKAYGKKEKVSEKESIFVDWAHSSYFGTTEEGLRFLKQYQSLDDQVPGSHYNIGMAYNVLRQYDNAIPELEKTIDIYDKWNSSPFGVSCYTQLGFAYNKTGQFRKEKRLYEKAEKDFPENNTLIYREAILAFSRGDTTEGNIQIEKFISVSRGNSYPEANIVNSVANLYSDAGIPDKAEEFYRKALSMEPGKGLRLNNLAGFLIKNTSKVQEGMDLIEMALESQPDNFNYLDTKGWGLYKQRKYSEAYELLQKSWDLRREKSVYNHEAFLRLGEAKKAVPGQQ